MRDARGVELAVGQSVAFNLSGTVALGRIVKLTEPIDRDTGYGWLQRMKPAKIEVELLHKTQGKKPGHISKISHEHNVMAL